MLGAMSRALGLVAILLVCGCASPKDDGYPDAGLSREDSGVDVRETGVDGPYDTGLSREDSGVDVRETGVDGPYDAATDTTTVGDDDAEPPTPCASLGAWSCAGVGTQDLLVCSDGGLWQRGGRCPSDQLCDATDGGTPGTCRDPIAACSASGPGTLVCDDEAILRCNSDLLTTTSVQACAGSSPACENGTCAECHPGSSRCFGDTVQQCGGSMTWAAPVGCDPGAVCNGVGCGGRSCESTPSGCGHDGDESCCTQLPVPGGTFKRDYNNGVTTTSGGAIATVSDFLLDKFEVSVSRFRNFVSAYPGSRPQPGDGAHPAVPGSGWQSAWDSALPQDGPSLEDELYCSPIFATYYGGYWTTNRDPLPVTCVSWELAFAFVHGTGAASRPRPSGTTRQVAGPSSVYIHGRRHPHPWISTRWMRHTGRARAVLSAIRCRSARDRWEPVDGGT